MPTFLSELEENGFPNYFKGLSYGSHNRRGDQAAAAPARQQDFHRSRVEGFSGAEKPRSTSLPSMNERVFPSEPEPLFSGSMTTQPFHPVDLLASNTGGIPAQLEKELEMETQKIQCRDALAHFRACKSCRQRILLELQHIEHSQKCLILGDEPKLSASSKKEKKKDEIMELLSFAGVGVFTIFLIDSFSKFGARLQA